VVGHNNATAVGATADPMTSKDALKDEPIGFQGPHELSS
jgi:hypothetical protein